MLRATKSKGDLQRLRSMGNTIKAHGSRSYNPNRKWSTAPSAVGYVDRKDGYTYHAKYVHSISVSELVLIPIYSYSLVSGPTFGQFIIIINLD